MHKSKDGSWAGGCRTHLFLSFDHALQECFKGVLEVLDTLLLETRDFGLHEARDVVKLLLCFQRTPLCFPNDRQ